MELALAFPYSLGLVAALNPCGFALLPAYLLYFLSSETRGGDAELGLLSVVLRGVVVGVTLTAGFVAVFGVFGVLFETVLNRGVVLDRIGYTTIVVGVAMVGLGVMLTAGRQVNLRLPKMSRGADGRGLVSVFMFGVSYAVVSLSCTIGLFLAGVAAAFTDRGFVDGVANFVAYGMGMGSLITFLTLALALARASVVTAMRRLLRWVNPISGLTLTAAGVYLANYGWWELRLRDDPTAKNILVDWFMRIQVEISAWVSHVGPLRLGVICAVGVAGALLLGWKAESRKTETGL